MTRMKLQFGVRSLLLTTAFVGVWFGAGIAIPNVFHSFILGAPGIDRRELAVGLVTLSPVWFPFAFVGYALGQRAITAKMLLALVVAEALALCAMTIPRHFHL
jgi:hypothetical protein